MCCARGRRANVSSHDSAAPASRAGEAMRFAPHLVSHAAGYFGDLRDGPVHVRLRSQSARRRSRLYEFELEGGGHSHGVLVKVPQGRLEDASPDDMQDGKSGLEYATLSGIQGVFGRLNDRRFGAVRPLDLLPDQGALVMEKIAGAQLSRLVAEGHRLRRPLNPAATETAVRHAGAWLRTWHQLAALGHTRAAPDQPPELLRLRRRAHRRAESRNRRACGVARHPRAPVRAGRARAAGGPAAWHQPRRLRSPQHRGRRRRTTSRCSTRSAAGKRRFTAISATSCSRSRQVEPRCTAAAGRLRPRRLPDGKARFCAATSESSRRR